MRGKIISLILLNMSMSQHGLCMEQKPKQPYYFESDNEQHNASHSKGQQTLEDSKDSSSYQVNPYDSDSPYSEDEEERIKSLKSSQEFYTSSLSQNGQFSSGVGKEESDKQAQEIYDQIADEIVHECHDPDEVLEVITHKFYHKLLSILSTYRVPGNDSQEIIDVKRYTFFQVLQFMDYILLDNLRKKFRNDSKLPSYIATLNYQLMTDISLRLSNHALLKALNNPKTPKDRLKDLFAHLINDPLDFYKTVVERTGLRRHDRHRLKGFGHYDFNLMEGTLSVIVNKVVLQRSRDASEILKYLAQVIYRSSLKEEAKKICYQHIVQGLLNTQLYPQGTPLNIRLVKALDVIFLDPQFAREVIQSILMNASLNEEEISSMLKE